LEFDAIALLLDRAKNAKAEIASGIFMALVALSSSQTNPTACVQRIESASVGLQIVTLGILGWLVLT